MRSRVDVLPMQGSGSQQDGNTQLKTQIRDAVKAATDAAKEAAQEAAADAERSQSNASDIGLSVQQALKQARDQGGSSVIVTAQGGNGGYSVHVAPKNFSSSEDTPFVPDIPRGAVDIVSIVGVTLVCCVVGFPIARAIARWMDRRGNAPKASPDVANRLQGIEQAVEAVALEVERISEGQRFTTRLLNERTQEPARDFSAPEREPLVVAPANSRRS